MLIICFLLRGRGQSLWSGLLWSLHSIRSSFCLWLVFSHSLDLLSWFGHCPAKITNATKCIYNYGNKVQIQNTDNSIMQCNYFIVCYFVYNRCINENIYTWLSKYASPSKCWWSRGAYGMTVWKVTCGNTFIGQTVDTYFSISG